MKDKFASTGLALMLIGAAMMDSENLAVTVGLMGVGFALFGAVAYMEWKEEHCGRKAAKIISGV